MADLVRQDPVGLTELISDALGRHRCRGSTSASAREATSARTAGGRLVIAQPRRPPYDAAFLPRARSGACARSARPSGPATRTRVGSATSRCPPLRGRVRRRAPDRARNRSGRQARKHLEHGRLAGADSAAALPRLPQPVAGRRRVAAVGAVAAGRARACSASPARRSRRPRRDRRPCCSASASTASCCSTSRIAWRWHRVRVRTPPMTAIGGPSVSMLLGMWTTAATFYGLTFVDFPSLQQLGLLIGHSMVVCGILTLVLVPALLPRRLPRGGADADHAAARGVDRRAVAAPSSAPRRSSPACSASPRRGCGSTRRSTACGRSPTRPHCSRSSIAPAFGLPRRGLRRARRRHRARAAARNQRATRRTTLRRSCRGSRLQPPTRLLPSAGRAGRAPPRAFSVAGLSPPAVRASLERRRRAAGFRPAPSSRSPSACRSCSTPSQRLTYDGYVAHGLGDLVGRFVVRDDDRWLTRHVSLPDRRRPGRAPCRRSSTPSIRRRH